KKIHKSLEKYREEIFNHEKKNPQFLNDKLTTVTSEFTKLKSNIDKAINNIKNLSTQNIMNEFGIYILNVEKIKTLKEVLEKIKSQMNTGTLKPKIKQLILDMDTYKNESATKFNEYKNNPNVQSKIENYIIEKKNKHQLQAQQLQAQQLQAQQLQAQQSLAQQSQSQPQQQ